MEANIFHNELRNSSMEQYIQKMLEIHVLMSLDEICRDSGCSKSDFLPTLESLIQHHKVERIRPVNYENDDMDFYRLCGPQRQLDSGTRSHWLDGLKKAVRRFFDDAEDNIEHHLNNILTAS